MIRDPVALLEDLIRIDSSNPDLVIDGAGESAIADFCLEWLEDRGFDTHRLEETPGRPSVVGVHRGTGGGRSIMVNGHLDTVSLGSYEGDGLDPQVRDGCVYGRGAYDMKSGVAAILVAAGRAAERPHAGDIVVALVADEEFASAGTEEVLRSFGADCGVVVEPSGLDVVLAHRGFVWIEVTILGRAAHGSRRDLGIDAIAKAGPFLTALAHHDGELARRDPHPLLGTASIHASKIAGGEELSSYPASCLIEIERRTLPGETAASVTEDLRAILDGIAEADRDFSYEISAVFERAPFAIDPSEPVVRALVTALTERTGRVPTLRGEPFWTDCALMFDAGIPTVLFGVDGGGAHAASEWVTVESLEIVLDVLEDLVLATVT